MVVKNKNKKRASKIIRTVLRSTNNQKNTFQPIATNILINTDYTQTKFAELEESLKTDHLQELELQSKAQNKLLERDFYTKSSKVQYQVEQTHSLNNIVYYLIWIYACIAAIFLGFLFVGPKSKNIPFYLKIMITLLLILYPYYIVTIEEFLYKLVQFAYSIIYGNVYLQSDY